MKLKPYPSYKDSGVEWLGKVPSEWDFIRLGFLFDNKKRPLMEGYGVVTAFRDGQVTLRTNRRIDGFTEADKEIGYQGVKPGDLVVHAMDAFAGAIGVSDSEGKMSPVCSVCEPKSGVISRYYGYLMRNIALTGYITSLAKGIRERSTDFRWSDARLIPVPVPENQGQIVTFLDRETTKLDTLISKQEKLIELLQEKRQAVISHAVTKGLNPDEPMKDSGVEWLGKVPERWNIKKLKYLCKIQTGDKDTVNAIEDGEYPFFVRSQTIEKINSYTFDCEAVLTAGDGAGVGKVFHYFTGKFDFHQRVYMMNHFRHVSGEFFFRYLSSLFHKVALYGDAKSTVDSLRMPILMNFLITVPCEQEQELIIQFIKRESAQLDNLIEKAKRSIDLAKEHRTALISAAVTGKIDVREYSY